MDKIEFCDKFCPIPARWVEFPKVNNELTVDCDLEESDCPFRGVDFSKVEESEVKPTFAEEVYDKVWAAIQERGFPPTELTDEITSFFQSVQSKAVEWRDKLIAELSSRNTYLEEQIKYYHR